MGLQNAHHWFACFGKYVLGSCELGLFYWIPACPYGFCKDHNVLQEVSFIILSFQSMLCVKTVVVAYAAVAE